MDSLADNVNKKHVDHSYTQVFNPIQWAKDRNAQIDYLKYVTLVKFDLVDKDGSISKQFIDQLELAGYCWNENIWRRISFWFKS